MTVWITPLLVETNCSAEVSKLVARSSRGLLPLGPWRPVSDRFDLEGRVAVITGGGTGIGRGSALVLAEHGADVRTRWARSSRSARIDGQGSASLGRRALRCRRTSLQRRRVRNWSMRHCRNSVASTSW